MSSSSSSVSSAQVSGPSATLRPSTAGPSSAADSPGTTNPQFSKVLSDVTENASRESHNAGTSPGQATTDSRRRPRPSMTSDANATTSLSPLAGPVAFAPTPASIPTTTPGGLVNGGSSQGSSDLGLSATSVEDVLNGASTSSGVLDAPSTSPLNSFDVGPPVAPGLPDTASAVPVTPSQIDLGTTMTEVGVGVLAAAAAAASPSTAPEPTAAMTSSPVTSLARPAKLATPSDSSILASVAESSLKDKASVTGSDVRSSPSTGARERLRRDASSTSPGSKVLGSGETSLGKQTVSAGTSVISRPPESTTSAFDQSTLTQRPTGAATFVTPLSSVGAAPSVAPSPAPAPGTGPGASSVTPLNVNGLASAISGALLDANGTYTVTVAMHPNELGHVQAVMSLNGTELHVALCAQSVTGHHALASTLDALKNELGRGGMNVNVALRDPSSDQRQESRQHSGGSSDDAVTTDDVATLSTVALPGSSHINLIL